MKNRDCATLKCLRTSLAALGIGVLLSACGGSSNKMADANRMMDDDQMMGDDQMGDGQMTQLGEWDTMNIMAGVLDVRDANDVLRAYYDSAGEGHVMAGTPVQPEGMGTATWRGMWSGEIEVHPNIEPLLPSIDLDPASLQGLRGGAEITAYFEGAGVEAELTYENLELEVIGISSSSITSDRVPVTGGMFRPSKTQEGEVALLGQTAVISGTFEGEGAFGGVNAEGVAGYMGGDISIDGLPPALGLPSALGTFKSVFYGTKEPN